jgi:Fe-S cluster assembly protein SufD
VQRHVTARGTSDFTLKGAVVDEARGVYSGVIVVEAGAKGTSAFLTNRNLVLSDGARVDSVPNLEIINENDLRSCGHAAATGPVDEEHLFYLESRGVPTEVAERLIVLGFFGEVLDEAPVHGLRELLRQAVAVKLQGRDGG